jgi:hypothetical protein
MLWLALAGSLTLSSNYSDWANAACTTLQEKWFNQTSGSWNGHCGQDKSGAYTQIGWWNAANSLEATVNCALLLPPGIFWLHPFLTSVFTPFCL